MALLAVAGLTLGAPVLAQKAKTEKQEMAGGGLYKCIDADGAVTYTNVGSVKGCKKVEGEVNSVTVVKSTPSARPADAKVDAGAQKSRDTDRRRILQDELANEQKRLDDLKKQYNNGEPERQGGERNYQKYLDRTQQLKNDVARSESNVQSLQRELDGLKN
jgi:pyridoxine/pyridoxamine 5'-phosphate oxidase